VSDFVGAVAAAAGDEEANKRASKAAPAVQRLATGEHVWGWPTLAKLLGGRGPEVVARVRDWLELDSTNATLGGRSDDAADSTKPGLVLECLADVAARPVSWLWKGHIPLGAITLLVGRPGEGKSFVTLDFAARLTRGTPWPDGSDCPKGSVILMSAEDHPATTIRPRLDAAGADVGRVHLLSAIRYVDDRGPYERLITLADVDAIAEAIKCTPDCRLVIIDPIGAYLGAQVDAHRDNEVRGILRPIAQLAERHEVAVLIVAHRRKSDGLTADDLALGSRAFTAAARAVWHLTHDPQNKARRLLLPGKLNLASRTSGMAFSIVGDPPRLAWETNPVAMDADDALRAESRRPGPSAEATAAAVAWLRTALAAGPRPAKELMDAWCGQGGSEKTLRRAKTALKVEACRFVVAGPWWWKLPAREPAQMANTPQGGDLGHLGHLAKNQGILHILSPQQSPDGLDGQDGQIGHLTWPSGSRPSDQAAAAPAAPIGGHPSIDGQVSSIDGQVSDNLDIFGDGRGQNTASPPGGNDPDRPAAKGGLPGAESRVEVPDPPKVNEEEEEWKG
jgi:hypothetical protein